MMFDLIRKAIRGQKGGDGQCLYVALLLAGMICAVVFSPGCSPGGVANELKRRFTLPIPGSQSVREIFVPIQYVGFQVHMEVNERFARPGDPAMRRLSVVGDTGTTPVSYRWTPPPGATGFSFSTEPEPGGPPYVWLNQSPTNEILIGYDQPILPPPPGKLYRLTTDTIEVERDGQVRAAAFSVGILAPAHPYVGLSRLAISPPRPVVAHNSPPATTKLWEIKNWSDVEGVTLTAELCQDWFDLFQSDDAFLAVRAPVSPTATITEGYPLPIVMGTPYSNTLQLYSYDAHAPVITVPMELRPERHTFLENELPSAPGEHWMAMGLVSETVTCPATALDAGSWSFLAQNLLDLTHQPDNCEQCVLPFYHCYEGQEAPLSAEANRAWGGNDVASYQGLGITCLGPYAIALAGETGWALNGLSTYWVTPTQTISLYHYVQLGESSEPMSFTLSYNSSLDVEWHFLEDTIGPPDPSKPLIQPLPVNPGGFGFFWMVSDPVPSDTAAGPYSLFVTAVSEDDPADSLTVSDAIWVGKWVAPPLTSPPGHEYRIYLPLVARSG